MWTCLGENMSTPWRWTIIHPGLKAGCLTLCARFQDQDVRNQSPVFSVRVIAVHFYSRFHCPELWFVPWNGDLCHSRFITCCLGNQQGGRVINGVTGRKLGCHLWEYSNSSCLKKKRLLISSRLYIHNLLAPTPTTRIQTITGQVRDAAESTFTSEVSCLAPSKIRRQ